MTSRKTMVSPTSVQGGGGGATGPVIRVRRLPSELAGLNESQRQLDVDKQPVDEEYESGGLAATKEMQLDEQSGSRAGCRVCVYLCMCMYLRMCMYLGVCVCVYSDLEGLGWCMYCGFGVSDFMGYLLWSAFCMILFICARVVFLRVSF